MPKWVPIWWRPRRVIFRPNRGRVVLSGLVSLGFAALVVYIIRERIGEVPIWGWSIVLPLMALSAGGVLVSIARFRRHPILEVNGATLIGYRAVAPWREAGTGAMRQADLTKIERAVPFDRIDHNGKRVVGVRLERAPSGILAGEVKGYDIPTAAFRRDAKALADFLNYRIERARPKA